MADVVVTADAVKKPAGPAVTPTIKGARNETYDNTDPHTGTLTAEALARRAEIRRQVVEAGKAGLASSWQAVLTAWNAMKGIK